MAKPHDIGQDLRKLLREGAPRPAEHPATPADAVRPHGDVIKAARNLFKRRKTRKAKKRAK